ASLAAAGYANGRLYAASKEPGRKSEAERLLPSFREKHPGLAAATALLVAASAAEVEQARSALDALEPDKLAEGFERAVVHVTLGEWLLDVGQKEKGLQRLEKAREADAGHVRALVRLGQHFLAEGEPEQAAKFLERARGASPAHVPALAALLKAKLDGSESASPEADAEALRKAWDEAERQDRAWPKALKADLELAEGRVLARQGRHVDAVNKLAAGANTWRERAPEFYAALGAAEAAAGRFDKAEAAYESALRGAPSEALLEELCRVLIARGSLPEVLKRAQSGADPRKLALLRGIAWFEQGELGRARDQLNATRRDGKVPLEAAIYLATIDALQGQRETARQVLETAAGKQGRLRAAALVGLGRLYQADGRRAEAVSAFTDASREPGDWEGACSLGRLHLAEGDFDAARRFLALATSRNPFHNEARVAHGHALLSLGEVDAAKKEFAAAIAEDRDAAAHRGMARALLATASVKEARKHAGRASRADPKNPNNTRLVWEL
ncbi:MAG: tetratricopeptide repeat protein, partial [Myxococcales bacterium]